jgi:membrane associated rhomboid family serine protease
LEESRDIIISQKTHYRKMSYSNRGGFLSTIPQVTKVILILNVTLFILDYLSGHLLVNYLALYSYHTHYFKPYQLVTHMFMHGSFGHIFFNMFGLFMFGKVLESVLGSKKFFLLYILSGLGAAALQLFIYYMQGNDAIMIGASGAVFGILIAFGMLFPNVELFLMFIPVPIKAKYLIPIYAVLELFLGVANFSGDNIAHFAHLGGAVVGFILIKIWKKNQFNVY